MSFIDFVSSFALCWRLSPSRRESQHGQNNFRLRIENIGQVLYVLEVGEPSLQQPVQEIKPGAFVILWV
jgi:hypothetical protein